MFIELNRKRHTLKNLHLATPDSEFEEDTLQFIQNWMEGIDNFQLTTSGSTGSPKTIKIPRNKMEVSAKATLTALKLKEKGNALVCLNTKFIAGKMMLVRALINKMNIIAVEPSSNPLVSLDPTQEFRLTAMVPLQMETVLDSDKYKNQLDQFDVILLGGAPVSHTLQQKLQPLKSSVYATYGMTETVSHIALKHLNATMEGTYFEALDGVELGLDDRGCLTICSKLTDNKILATNDLVKLIDRSTFEWLGRFDNIINTGGIKVLSEELESQIAQVFNDLQITNRFFCYGMPDEKLGQKIILVVEGSIKEADPILQQIKKKVSRFHEPKDVFTTPKFIETTTKKIQRKLTMEKVISSLPSA